MQVLVIGSGAREHALALSLSQDPAVSRLHAAPGNPGIAVVAECHDVKVSDVSELAALAERLKVDLVVVGPEQPLVDGVGDLLRQKGIACFGPSQQAALLEGSKAFAKDVMHAAAIPTAQAVVCTEEAEVPPALDRFQAPYVVKDDGLAGGKGVVVTDDREQALAHAAACLAKPDGRVVIEEFLDGPEVSLFCLSDGSTVVPLAPAQDFKRVGDGDAGPNTGGMGAYSPLTWAPASLVDDIVAQVAQPLVDEMRRRGTPFVGLLYCGLALTSAGIKVVEFNVRFGDPETQVVLARLQTPLGTVLHAAATGGLADLAPLEWDERSAVVVIVASHNYPANPRLGDPIGGVAQMAQEPDITVFHAGTSVGPSGQLVSAGGRVLAVLGVDHTLERARKLVYGALRHLTLPGAHYRRDIASAGRLPSAS